MQQRSNMKEGTEDIVVEMEEDQYLIFSTIPDALIGSGSTSLVFRGCITTKESRKTCAVKVYKDGSDSSKNESIALERINETENISKCLYMLTCNEKFSHEYLSDETEKGLFVYEYFPNTLLSKALGKDTIKLEQILIWVKDLLKTLITLKEKHILHNDIKLSNVLVDDQNNISLCDFGSAVFLNVESPTGGGTTIYTAPELISGSKVVETQSDLYSLGVLIFLLLSDTSTIRKSEKRSNVKSIVIAQKGLLNSGEYSINNIYSNHSVKKNGKCLFRCKMCYIDRQCEKAEAVCYLINMISECLDSNPEKRPDPQKWLVSISDLILKLYSGKNK
eukprot:GHVP01027052.1.p1 GENE.GHVP01027052.1~~GHVP01027052.1.p1  ORF type:complete len:334 (-),score=51.15 GHVP01027052.1:2145-3146(-)